MICLQTSPPPDVLGARSGWGYLDLSNVYRNESPGPLLSIYIYISHAFICNNLWSALLPERNRSAGCYIIIILLLSQGLLYVTVLSGGSWVEGSKWTDIWMMIWLKGDRFRQRFIFLPKEYNNKTYKSTTLLHCGFPLYLTRHFL